MQRLPLAEGTPEGLEVWHLALDLTAPIADDDDRLLSRAEWQRAQRFRHRADAVRAMATRAALRRLGTGGALVRSTRVCTGRRAARYRAGLRGAGLVC